MKKYLFVITSHLIFIVGFLIIVFLPELDSYQIKFSYNPKIPKELFIINMIIPFAIHVRYRFYNNGKAGGGPLNILWNYVRGNNSYNGEEDLIYARTVISIAIVSSLWLIINKFFL